MAVKAFPLPEVTWRSNLRALWMVAKKDWQHFWRYPLNALSSVFQPLIWLTPVYFMGMAFSVDGKAHGFAAYSGSTDYMSFVLVGMVLNNYVQTVFWNMGFSLKWDMDSGVLESNWLTPTSRPLLLIGRTFTSLLVTTILSAGMLLLAALVFGFRPTGNVLAAGLAMLPLLIGLYGFGIAFAGVVLIMRDANSLVDMSSYLVNVFSGAQFPVQSLPVWLMPVSLILPITFGYDAVRGWLLNTRTLLPIPVEVGMMVVFMFLMTWTGLVVFNRIERKVRERGTLGQH
jgi:ABC-2 type transport system permease protein